ncbi:pyroglutamyl-peptidase I [Gleimia sp. 6138-11-ORH1]|uniref:pyroglutamyl-peptidase I n=1 Tax=Gleimia sp. 6138-11-ORH1 TaxID=2973937 RepID=UPI00216805AD|nr:pyroglutamyl-peptidase I [Gleimia sp. 6138-11-ORH1]MCS4484468.1 pyroglutamyl-peptidase I [Gleimia sp. 6138-11-ORH1]
MRVLITGFDPFGEETINPAWEAVQLLPHQVGKLKLIKEQLPTSFTRALAKLETILEGAHFDYVVLVGQHGGVSALQIERVAINLANARMTDNDGYAPQEQPVIPAAPTAYFASLPTQQIVEAICETGIPAQASFSAGTFVCNASMFYVLHLAATKYPHLKAGFIHVPYLPQQVVTQPGVASLPKETTAAALETALRVLGGY